ncbi:hypothetical protein KPL78_05615 [Roseomonas sp. HJA6]|uniref:DUF3757 domain-containing protein n=1 Tax=Roseomonas alba TaxID=2846776 RepID=A0ABS7A4U1_9PROT|nr:hypothetical protein [Neoroseomonas alba]MBW6397317.1 hypothetical protein [Neoroseomonas alba]
MIRCAASLLAATLLAASPGRADCFDWDLAATTDRGTLSGLPSGPLRWRIGLSAAGGIHQATSVEIAWTGPDGVTWRQTLFEEIQDGRPALRARRGRLELRVTYCAAGGACRDTTLPYAWDARARRFVGTDRKTRESLAAACGSLPERVPTTPSEPAVP